ncbi:hypothetical protein V7S43_017544 [Phytophthora oleae]|uniref:Uncharacterized protein n=1 Tax=Phytophthora oleae TaxID=2107226 RepID=A0ABD3EV57_9STRA
MRQGFAANCETLHLHLLFKTEEAACLFEIDLTEGPLTLDSPLSDQVVTTSITQVKAVSSDLQRILYADYGLQETEPQNSSVSLTTSVRDLDLD